MSLREYARRRGVSAMAVSDACKADRLLKSIARDASGRVAGITDPLLADLEWAANTDTSKAPPKEQARAAERAPAIAKLRESMSMEGVAGEPAGEAGEESTMQNAAVQAKLWDARLKELKYRKAAGELVPALDVEREVRDVFTHCKARLLAIPSALRQLYPDLSVEHMDGVDRLIRETLEELTAPSLTAEAAPELEDLPELEEPA